MTINQVFFATDFRTSKIISAGPESSRLSFVIHSLSRPDFAPNAKKGALRLVQVPLTLLSSAQFSKKSRRKNEDFEGKIDPFQPFFSLFQAFSGTWSIRHIIALVALASRPLVLRICLPCFTDQQSLSPLVLVPLFPDSRRHRLRPTDADETLPRATHELYNPRGKQSPKCRVRIERPA